LLNPGGGAGNGWTSPLAHNLIPPEKEQTMKARFSNLVRLLFALGLAVRTGGRSYVWRGRRFRRLACSVMLAAAFLAAPLQAQIVFDATADFSITNGNPNGVWSYGWMPTNFSVFNLLLNNSNQWGNLGSLLYGWYGWSEDHAPHILLDRGSGIHPYVPAGWLAFHPGNLAACRT
jgi:hypothetical protein